MAADWFVGPVMENLINRCFEYLEDQFRWQTGMKEELERLRKNHPKIQAVVFAATQAQIGDRNLALNKWLWQLRDVIDEADDLLDEFEYMVYKELVAENNEETKVRSATTSFLFEPARKLRKIGERALKNDPNLKRLEEVVQKLDEVAADVGTFLHLMDNTKKEQQEQQHDLHKTRETGPLPRNDLIGRSKDKEFVLQWLRQPSNEEHETQINSTALYRNISLLSIVGHGGMGKTTLLQHVYEDEITKEFDLKMWVCVSINFDAKKVIADMLECLKKERPRLESISTLQENLKSEVQSKKFLLILDDIWDEEERHKRQWEDVLAPLAYGSLGSKILVTTRMDLVAAMIAKLIKKKKETLILKGLEEDECLQLLNTHAFANVENSDDHTKLRSISIEIAKKLSGSPLAAKVTGGALNSSLDERYWITVLNSDFRNTEIGQNAILPILRLSYTFLPRPLQNCFAFCSIFPQDHMIKKEDLVQMWIAVGFIQLPSNSGETMDMEDVGGRYFDILVKKSFFDEVERNLFYKMHDLLHELAQSIFAQESFRVVHDEDLFSRIPNTIRHLVVEISDFKELKWMIKLKNLRSLYLTYKKDDQDFVDVLSKIFEASKSLRLLYVHAPYLKFIPEAIGCLIHLRYLNISAVHNISLLPRSLSNLYHLQFIIFKRSYSCSDNFFPKDMNNLFNLHHVTLPTSSGIHGIGKLTSLQTLDEFHVKDENGYRIGELEHMNKLRDLTITHLENVKDAMEVCNAKLCDKRDLTNLSLEWGHLFEGLQNIVDPDLDESVLDNLQPNNNLKVLTIAEYMGVRSAIWMNKAHLISNLEFIFLNKCLEWQTLPPFGQLPFLKSLHLIDMPKVKRLENKFHENDRDCGFPSLTVLRILKLEALEEWFGAAAAAATQRNCFFPCLRELHLEDCPNLQELPYLPPKLEMLEMKNIGWKTLNFFSISKSIPLERVNVIGCPNITIIPLTDEIARLAALRHLKIVDCPNLISLGGHQEVEIAKNCHLTLNDLTISDPSLLIMEPLRSITSLKNLYIERNDELVSFPTEVEQWFLHVSSSLCHLEFTEFKSLQSLPSSLESLSALKSLHVCDVPQLMQLPNIPISVNRLWLEKLKLLHCLPSSLSTVSSLRGLELCSIPLLKSLPDLPPSLDSLRLQDLENLDCLPSCLPSLSSLTIKDVSQLRELPDLPPSLRLLELNDLENLHCLPSCLPSLSSLEQLSIYNVPQLRELPDLPHSLVYLMLTNLENLNCLPSCLRNLSSLKRLRIHNVPQLQELPDLSSSLNILLIENCHSELMERYKKFSGSYWHKIAHIPRVYIS